MFPPDHWYQTKDLECLMYRYEITADGRLLGVGGDVGPSGEPFGLPKYHGVIDFYDAANDGETEESVEYRATFTGGRLVDVAESRRTREAARPPCAWRTPAPEVIAQGEARQAERLVGRTLYVLRGGLGPQKPYAVKVVAESDRQLVFQAVGGEFEIEHRAFRDSLFFDSEEDAMSDLARREAESRVEQEAWERRKADWEARNTAAVLAKPGEGE